MTLFVPAAVMNPAASSAFTIGGQSFQIADIIKPVAEFFIASLIIFTMSKVFKSSVKNIDYVVRVEPTGFLSAGGNLFSN